MSKNSKYKFSRNYDNRKPYKFIYIFTEGKETEPNYFNSKKIEIEEEIRRRNIKIEIKGVSCNTLSLVDYALHFIKEENIKTDIDECWVVFDKDDFDRDFDNAINKARRKNLKVAYSNESFELWFLLHFDLVSSAIRRDDYNSKLTDNLKKLTGNRKTKYRKTTKNMFSLLKEMEEDAIRNAKYLLNMHKDETSFLKKNPSTTVHLLVENLNKLKKE